MNTEASDRRMDELLRKIRLLKAKAEKTTNEHEAAAFAAKVAQMLAEHGLEEAQLRTEEQSDIVNERNLDEWKASPSRRAMASALCKLYMVRCVWTRKTATLFGRKANIIMVKEMSEYLVRTTVRLSSEWRRANMGTNAQMIDFRRGCFQRLTERIMEMHRDVARNEEPKYLPNGNPANLPALVVNEMQLIDPHVRLIFPFLGRVVHRANVKYSAGMAGRDAGSGISLNQQLGNGRSGGPLQIGRK